MENILVVARRQDGDEGKKVATATKGQQEESLEMFYILTVSVPQFCKILSLGEAG